MAVDGAQDFVQLVFPDQPGIGFPGDVYKPSYHSDALSETKALGNGPAFCGRMVSIGTLIDYTNNEALYATPHTIRLLETSDVAMDFFGVVTRPISGAQNFTDVDGKDKAGFGTKEKISVMPLGSGVEIIVRQEPTLGQIDWGTAVYVAVDVVNSALIQVGEFATNSLGTTGLVVVPNAIWYLSKTANTTDAVGVIKFK